MATMYGRSPYSGQQQMGGPPLDDEFLDEPDPAPPVHSYYSNGYDNRSDLRVPMPGLGPAPGSPMMGSSPVPIEPEGHDDSPPGLYMDDNYADSPASYGGNGSLTRWDGNLSVYGGGGGSGGNQRARSPMQPRNDTMWDENTVTLRRQAKYGFGLAVSGGRDNPHYQSGETSIVVSDVLAQGPAQNRLKINDRLLIVNGQSMENVYHKAAVDALRQAGNTVTITFKRKKTAREPVIESRNYSTLDAAPKRTPVQAPTPSRGYQSLPRTQPNSAPPKMNSQPSARSSGDSSMDMRNTVYLRKKRTEGYGMQLGWVLFVQGLSDQGIASTEGVKQGDTINKINNIPVETLSYADARKLIQASKDKLMLDISRNRDNSLPPQISLNKPSSSFETPVSRQPDPMQDIFVPQPTPDDDPIVALQGPTSFSAPPRPPLPSDSNDFDSLMPPRPPSPGADETMGPTVRRRKKKKDHEEKKQRRSSTGGLLGKLDDAMFKMGF